MSLELNLDLNVVQTPKYIILDTDMGTDDMWALVMLLKAEKYFSNIKLLAITCVHGNTSMENVLINTFAVLDMMDRPDVRPEFSFLHCIDIISSYPLIAL